MSGFLRLESVGKRFGNHSVLESISLDVEQGEFLTLLGESGSGKTTLLRILAGFEEATAGRVLLDDQRLDALPPHRRPIHTVFQSYALFPHMSVFDNVAYGLRVRGCARERNDHASRGGAGKSTHGALRQTLPQADQRRAKAAGSTSPGAGEQAAAAVAR